MTVSKKINSPEELKALQEKMRADLDLRRGAGDTRITVHMGTCGIAAGARDVMDQLAAQLAEGNVKGVTLHRAGCLGLCDQEPMLTLVDKHGKEFRYGRLDRKRIRDIVREHVVGGNPVVDYIISY